MTSSPEESMMEGASGETEVDLLLQFQCMGTNDRDALINEFQRLLGPNNLQPEACSFFLEMNNWNLQQAICSYFDFDSPKDLAGQTSLPSMTLIKDVTVGDGEEVPPNTRFVKTWKIQNPGREQWPLGCSLRFLGGAQMTNQERASVEPLHPGHSCDVSIEMMSPPTPGIYEGQWRMTTPSGLFFGEVIWVIVSVAEGGLLGLTQQMNAFHSLGSSPPNNSPTALTAASGFSNSYRPQPVVTVTSPDFSTVDLTRPSFPVERISAEVNHSSSQDGMNVDMTDSSFASFPGVKRPSLIDKVKDPPQDDNQENCIQICKEILTRSSSISCPSTSYEGVSPPGVARRGSVKSCSPLAVNDGLSRSLTPSSSSSSSSESTPQLFSRLQRQGSPQVSASMNSSNGNNNIAVSLNRTEASFPPTPPSEDMML